VTARTSKQAVGGDKLRAQVKGLNDKQAAFVREYLVDFNATQAAIRAGYSPKTAQEQGSRLLSNVMVQAELKAFRERAAEQTQTDINWVRQRLKEEATDYTEFASHSARIKAIELLARLNGDFEKDNKQKTDPLVDVLKSLGGNVLGPGRKDDSTDEEEDD
jgi:phage terminase small subunit